MAVSVRASLWLKDVLSRAAPFLGRKMLFGAGEGCLKFSVCSSSRLSGDVSAVWGQPVPQYLPGSNLQAPHA